MNPRLRLILLRILALVFVIGISIFVFLIRDKAEQLQGYGYLGIFLSCLFSLRHRAAACTWVAVVFTWGSIFHPAGIALAAGAGAALGRDIWLPCWF